MKFKIISIVLYSILCVGLFSIDSKVLSLNNAALNNNSTIIQNFLVGKIYRIEVASNVEDWYFSGDNVAFNCDSSTQACLYESHITKRKFKWEVVPSSYGVHINIYSLQSNSIMQTIPVSFLQIVASHIALCGVYAKDINYSGQKCGKEDVFLTPSIYFSLSKNGVFPTVK